MIRSCALILSTTLTCLAAWAAEPGRSELVHPGADGRLVYADYSGKGDTIPDFSLCGYRGGGVAIPSAAVKETLEPQAAGDDAPRIQAAIDRVSALAADAASGLRGAVLLKKGAYRLSRPLWIRTSGVVLRGEGSGADGTVLTATYRERLSLIKVGGAGDVARVQGSRRLVSDDYVPVGARSLNVANASAFHPGDAVLVVRLANDAWIATLGMDHLPPRKDGGTIVQWEASKFSLTFDRVVTAVEGNRLTFDAPITCAIEAGFGGGEVWLANDNGRVSDIGVEDLRGDCEFDATKMKTRSPSGDTERCINESPATLTYLSDEDHATYLVEFGFVKHAWAQRLATRHLYHGVVDLEPGAKWVTVRDCSARDPVSVIDGGRRYAFNNSGQLNLIARCTAREARHAFVLESGRVPGPNVFLECSSEGNFATSEPHQRWSVGGLYDNVVAPIAFQDRLNLGTGHGWSGANYVAWNCTGHLIIERPPTAQNFAIGFVGSECKSAFSDLGHEKGRIESFGTHVEPRSLYLSQLADRIGADAVRAIWPAGDGGRRGD